jgi:AraC-like DNA-binding protein
MQPAFQKIEANVNYSFYVEHEKFPFFPNPLQFHPEIEIIYVIQGTGTLFIGDSVIRFYPDDLVIIGKNIPHVWYSDEKYKKGNSNLYVEVIYILFKTEIFGEQFWQLPESKILYKLLQRSQRGISVTGKTRAEVSHLMRSISKSTGCSRLIILLSILEKITTQKEYKFLTSSNVQNMINAYDSDRLNKVYDYVMHNFHQDITLKQIASLASLSIPSFCRYFKKRTNKTFIKLLTEIRISHACRLLTEEDLSVTSVCYICGFTNVSYFIRQFKDTTGLTPFCYRKNFTL